MISSALVFLLCLVLAGCLRSRLIYVISVVCWTQNIILPWIYTEGWIEVQTARSLLVMKEVLLLFLAGYVAWRGRWIWRRGVPPPMVWILAYGTWVVMRAGVGGVLLGEPILSDLRLVRSMVFPLEAVFTGFMVALLAPQLPARYERFTVVGVVVVSVASLALYFLPSDTFWLNHVNLALYNVNVKGDPEWTVLSDLGVSGSGAGREMFSALSPFRLFGTLGDPLTAGMVFGLAVLVVLSRRSLRLGLVTGLTALGTALFLTFSRSAWVFVAVGFVYLAVVARQPIRLVLFLIVLGFAWTVLGPLRQFLGTTIASFGLQAGDVYHAEGILNFYSREILKPAYLLGTGPLDTSAQSWVLESGFGYLLIQFGLPLLLSFIGFCLSAERYLRRRSPLGTSLGRLGAACALSTLVVSNLSFYALSFTAYFGIWSVLGLGIGVLHRTEVERSNARALSEDASLTGVGR